MKMQLLPLKTIFLIGTFCSTTLFTYGQIEDNTYSINQRITIEANDIKLIDLLQYLQKDMDVPVVYAIDNIPASSHISILASDMLLSDFFDELSHQTDITWTKINGFFVIKYEHKNNSPTEEHSIHNFDSIESLMVSDTNTNNNTPIQKKDLYRSKHLNPKNLPYTYKSIHNNPSHQISYHQGSDLAIEQKQNKGINISDITAFYSFDFHKFYFKPGLTDDQYYRSEWNYSLGITTSYMTPIDRFSITSGILYSTKDFRYFYNYKVLDIEDPIPIPDIMFVELNYLEIPVKINYQFINYQSVNCKVSIGYHASFSITERETTSYQNTDDQETSTCITSTSSFLQGASLGTTLAYQINSTLNFSLEPRYIQYFLPVNKQIMQTATHLFRVNVGIKYTFKSIK